MLRNRELIYLLLAIAFSRIISIYSFYLYDDAFITFRYAANFAEGHGLVYNLGEPVQGITTPIWGLLLAVFYKMGFPFEYSSRILSLLFDLASGTIIYLLLKRENLHRAAIWSLFLFALDTYLAKAAVGGMEASLFLLVILIAVKFVMEKRLVFAAVASALSVFIRPEGLLFCLTLLVGLSYENKRIPIKEILWGLSILAIGFFLQYSYYGDLVPQSVRAKAALSRNYDGIWGLILFPLRDPVQLFLTFTALGGVFLAWQKSKFVQIYGRWIALLLAVWVITGAHLWNWYCTPVWFFKIVMTGVFIEYLAQTNKIKLFQVIGKIRPIYLCLLILLSWSMLAFVLGRDKLEMRVYAKIREWSKTQNFNRQSAYGMDFGAFGYYTKLRILDEPGLVYPPSLKKYNCDLKTILLSENPEWAYVTNYLDNPQVMQSSELAVKYEPVWRVSMKGDTDLSFSLDEISEKWSPDFTLYRKITPK